MVVVAKNANYSQIKPLLIAVLTSRSDIEIWEQVYHAVIASTPSVHGTSDIINSTEFRSDVNSLPEAELRVMYADVPNFDEAFSAIPQASRRLLQRSSRNARVRRHDAFKKVAGLDGQKMPTRTMSSYGWPTCVIKSSDGRSVINRKHYGDR